MHQDRRERAAADRWAFEEVYLVRHGQTEWNRIGRRQGQLDSPLTEQGRGAARALGRTIAGIVVDGIFASPLGRARATAGVISEAAGQPVVVVAELAEVDHGGFAGLSNEEIEQRHPGVLQRRARDRFRWRFPGGESYADADVRAQRALTTIGTSGSRRPLLVVHEMIGRMLFRQLLELDPAEALERSLRYGLVYQVMPEMRSVAEIECV